MTEQPAEPVVTDETLLQKLWRLEFLKGELDHIKTEMSLLTADIERTVEDSVIFTDPDGVDYRAKVIRPSPRVDVDLHMLSVRRPELYQRITKTVLDSPALTKALKAGAVDPEIANEAFSFTPITPHVRFTDVSSQNQEEEADEH